VNPPALARILLYALAGEHQAEYVAGDLHEEFVILSAERGRAAGARWYVWQVLRSAASLLGLRFRSGEAAHLMAAAILAVAMPLLLLDRLWRFVYSQIPLKDGLHRAPGFWVANLICVSVCAAVCGSLSRSVYRAAGVAVACGAAAACALWCGKAVVPQLFAVVIVLAAPVSSLAIFAWRRSR